MLSPTAKGGCKGKRACGVHCVNKSLWEDDISKSCHDLAESNVDDVNRLNDNDMGICAAKPTMLCVLGSRGPPQDILAICIKPHVPKPDTLHQTLRLLEFPISSKY